MYIAAATSVPSTPVHAMFTQLQLGNMGIVVRICNYHSTTLITTNGTIRLQDRAAKVSIVRVVLLFLFV